MGKREEKLQEKLLLMTEYEQEHWQRGECFVAGIDEVGRGPLAGPVVVACVIMPHDDLILGVDDSKKISEKKREVLFEEITKKAIDYSVCIIEPKEIDEINILQATKKAFEGALCGLKTRPDHVYTDAMNINTELPYTAVIKADTKIYTVAAASIVAKVTRDRMMIEYAKQYPEYGFESHKGYGTPKHYAALKEFGALSIHRKTFLRKFFENEQ